MGIFYESVKKMRKLGRSLVIAEKPVAKVKTAPKAPVKESKETAVKKDDKGTGRKA